MSGSRIFDIPFCTLGIVVTCVIIHIMFFSSDLAIGNFSIMARNVSYLGEWYRIITSAFIHANLIHIGFNMMSTLAIGGYLESDMGTIKMTFILWWSVILSGVLHVLGQLLFAAVRDAEHAQQHLTQQAVGFSGVIFTFAVMECSRSTEPYRTVFGMMKVPTKLYPWILMAAIQLFMPEISFAGHLSGAVVGVLHVYGLTMILLPSNEAIKEMEQWKGVRYIKQNCPNFKPCPAEENISTQPSSLLGFFRWILKSIVYIFTFLWWVFSAILHIANINVPNLHTDGFREVPQSDIELGAL